MERSPFAMVLGGGGWFGIGYHLGILDALHTSGFPVRSSPILGTSAGSWAGAATLLGVDFDTLVNLPTPRWPDPRPGALERAATMVFTQQPTPLLQVVACDVPRLRRHVLSGDHHLVAVLVAASSAVPGLLAPQRIKGTLYVDGGVRSPTSVDLAPAADMLVVVAPMAGRTAGGRRFEQTTRREVAHWERHHKGRVVVITPDAALSTKARFPHRLFDRELAKKAFETGQHQGTRIAIDLMSERTDHATCPCHHDDSSDHRQPQR